MEIKPFLNLIAQTIYDKKGINSLALDVRGISTLTDYVVIAEGNVDRHVMGIANGILDALEERGIQPHHVEGLQDGEWVVLDFMNVMVHLFSPGFRDKYQLEELWKEGKILDLEINTNPLQTGTYGNSIRK